MRLKWFLHLCKLNVNTQLSNDKHPQTFRFGNTLVIMAKTSKIEGDYELVTEKVTLETTPSLKKDIPAMKKRILETLIFLRDSPRLSGINKFQKNRAYQFFWAAHAFP